MLKYISGLIGVIILGALGSGLWSIIAPGAGTIGRWLLTVITLGINTVRDSTYEEAAIGHHELASLHVLFFVAAFFLAFPMTMLITTVTIVYLRTRTSSSSIQVALSNPRFRHRILFANCAIAVLAGTSIFVQFLLVNQQNLIASFFQQRLTILRPYISEKDIASFESQFASMDSKLDYQIIMDDLAAIATKSQIDVPEVSTW